MRKKKCEAGVWKEIKEKGMEREKGWEGRTSLI